MILRGFTLVLALLFAACSLGPSDPYDGGGVIFDSEDPRPDAADAGAIGPDVDGGLADGGDAGDELDAGLEDGSTDAEADGGFDDASEDAGFEDAAAPGQVRIRAARAGNGSGEVTSADLAIRCGGTCFADYDPGDSVELTATASTGSDFSSWAGCDQVNGAVCTLQANASRTATATFELQRFPLRVSLIGSGSVRIPSGMLTCNASACMGSFDYGSVVELQPLPAGSNGFLHFSGACRGAVCRLTITAATDVIAEFSPRLVAYYAFEGGAADSSGRGLDGQIVVPVQPVAGRVGAAFGFGNPGFVAVPDNALLEGSSDGFTACAWILPGTGSAAAQVILEKVDSYALTLSGTGASRTLTARITAANDTFSASRMIGNAWTHACFTYNGGLTGTVLRLYTDGQERATDSAVLLPGDVAASNTALTIGGCTACGNRSFDGVLDEVKIWQRELDAGEVLDEFRF